MDGDGAEVVKDDSETIDGMKPKGEAQLKRFEKLLATKINDVQVRVGRSYPVNPGRRAATWSKIERGPRVFESCCRG